MVGHEAEYLQNQFMELQALRQAAQHEAPPGAACSLQRAEEAAAQRQQQQLGEEGEREEVERGAPVELAAEACPA